MNTKLVLSATATLFVLAIAPSAFAEDYCVGDPSCVSAGGTDEPTVEAALAAADATAPADRVLIGPGTYVAPTTSGFQAKLSPVEVIGAGAGPTVLTGPTDATTVLTLGMAGSRVADLAVAIPANTTINSKYGLDLTGTLAERVKVTVDPAMSTAATGIYPRDGTVVQDSDVDMTATPAAVSIIGVNAQANTTVRRSTIAGRVALEAQGAHVHFDRNLIRSSGTGITVVNSGDDVEATNSVIQITGSGTGVLTSTGNDLDAGIALRGDTIVGDGTPSSFGVIASSNTAHKSTITVDSSIVRGFATSVKAVALAQGASADLAIQYSDYDSSKTYTFGPATITPGPGNINGDPRFAGVSGFHLQASSPAIDAGNPADLGDAADYDGNGRVTDGNGDSIARRDMGAFEAPALQPPPDPSAGEGGGGDLQPVDQGTSGVTPPDPAAAGTPGGAAPSLMDRTAPVITGLRARHGARLTFKLSEYAVVRVVIVRRGNTAHLRKVGTVSRIFKLGPARLRLGRVGGKALRPGSYVATVTAMDAAHNRSRAYSVRFKVGR